MHHDSPQIPGVPCMNARNGCSQLRLTKGLLAVDVLLLHSTFQKSALNSYGADF